ncbi:LysR family transcriptional regulator [Bacillus sp. S2(2019)]|uniref:LysR family transcriptional regulator n=1 Tax=Bacillus TaxID=1386 RepID=UPI0010ADBCB6|nr:MULTISPECIES: LysR family transcriptional regulator [unclassified Bacillus (in: firmicutes)]TKD59939.1 LysR family transcriptional regulator [Bacillus sp. S2(2019)]
MEWEQLEYFQTLAKLEHVTKAAVELSISQPALSRSIARLENHLGVQLFDRYKRSIKLNAYGRRFLIRVETILYEYQEGKNEIQSILNPFKGEVSLGFLHTLGTTVVPLAIKDFQSQYPDIHFQLKQNHSYWLLDQLKKGELDLCLLASVEIDDTLQWMPLWTEDLYLFVSNTHPLSAVEEVRLEALANEPFIVLKHGYALRRTVEDLFSSAQIQPEIVFESEEVATAAGFISAGLGISILPDLKGLDQTNMTKIRIQSSGCKRTIGLAWIKDRSVSPVVHTFKQYLHETYK